MAQALTHETPTLDQCLDGFISVARRLAIEWGVTIEHTELPHHHPGEFDGDTRTVRIRPDAPLEDQVWLLSGVWFLLTFGPHAAPHAHRQPHLQLVPAPRAGA